MIEGENTKKMWSVSMIDDRTIISRQIFRIAKRIRPAMISASLIAIVECNAHVSSSPLCSKNEPNALG